MDTISDLSVIILSALWAKCRLLWIGVWHGEMADRCSRNCEDPDLFLQTVSWNTVVFDRFSPEQSTHIPLAFVWIVVLIRSVMLKNFPQMAALPNCPFSIVHSCTALDSFEYAHFFEKSSEIFGKLRKRFKSNFQTFLWFFKIFGKSLEIFGELPDVIRNVRNGLQARWLLRSPQMDPSKLLHASNDHWSVLWKWSMCFVFSNFTSLSNFWVKGHHTPTQIL